MCFLNFVKLKNQNYAKNSGVSSCAVGGGGMMLTMRRQRPERKRKREIRTTEKSNHATKEKDNVGFQLYVCLYFAMLVFCFVLFFDDVGHDLCLLLFFLSFFSLVSLSAVIHRDVCTKFLSSKLMSRSGSRVTPGL